jgi:cysteinyl-tRNA synthetase
MAVLFDLVREVNRTRDTEPAEARRLAATLKHLGGILGLLQDDPESFLHSAAGHAEGALADADIEGFIHMRSEARNRRDFRESDRIRDMLAKHGVILEDGPAGTTWRRA